MSEALENVNIALVSCAHFGPWSGGGALCSRCARRPVGGATSLRPPNIQDLRLRLVGAKARLRGATGIDLQVASILERHLVASCLAVKRTVRVEHLYRQARRGRPGPDIAYCKITKRRFDIEWTTNTQAVAYDCKSDGMYRP